MKRRSKGNSVVDMPHASVPGSMAAYALQHREWLEIKNYSADTQRHRLLGLRVFFRWCAERSLYKPEEITRPILEAYQKHLYYYKNEKTNRKLCFASQERYLVAVRMFFRWLTRQNYIPLNPASEMELPRPEHRLPDPVLTAAEVDQVINQADIREPLGLRDRAILETFYSTGIRRSEMIKLTVYNIDYDRKTVFIHQGKGKKDRIIPIGDRALFWVEKYLNESRPKLTINGEEQTLFLTVHGDTLTGKYLSSITHEYVSRANLSKKGSCHLFRHTMASLMLEGGADIRYIQQILGHSDLTSTQVYTHVSIEKLKEVHAATHPAKLAKESNMLPRP